MAKSKRIVLGEGYSADDWRWDFLADVKNDKCVGRMFHIPIMFEGKKKYRLVLEKIGK